MKKLIIQGIIKYILGLVLVALLVFLPAGTFVYPGGWMFMGLLFIPMLILGAALLVKAPELLAKRLNNKEEQSEQKKVVGLSGLMFLAGFILCGLDFRWGWTAVPVPVIAIAAVLLLVGYGLYMEVMRENAYLSRTVEVQEGQKVIDTGLYGIVRHPMYFATVIMFLAIPLVLDSWIGFVVFLVYPFLMVKRIKNEEMVLEEGLEGYREYKNKVKYRMIPFLW
jgi:protein-S-isoprenylcysteine O-methyltransferase Ste14